MIPFTPLTDDSPAPFGKYKGTPMGKVPAEYLDWLHDQPWLAQAYPAVLDYIEKSRKEITAELSEKDDEIVDDDVGEKEKPDLPELSVTKGLEKIMEIMNEAYPDDEIDRYFRDPNASGDGLAGFVVQEVHDTFPEDASWKDQISEAIRVVAKAREELEDIERALLESLDKE